MKKIISYNVNGIRGSNDQRSLWLDVESATWYSLCSGTESWCRIRWMFPFEKEGYHLLVSYMKKGYKWWLFHPGKAGSCGIWFGILDSDSEGQVIVLMFLQEMFRWWLFMLHLVQVEEEERQAFKMEWLASFGPYIKNSGRKDPIFWQVILIFAMGTSIIL